MLRIENNKTIEAQDTTTDISDQVLKRRYLLKEANGRIIETPEQMYRRVAKTVAGVEKHYDTPSQVMQRLPDIFYDMMAKGRFLPNSPTLMNAGKDKGMLSACFVLPVNDNVPEIFDTVKSTALIQKAGGGTGFAFDSLRPTGDIVSSSGGTTSGPISFWRVIAETTHAIQQGAHRRGANMGMMRLDHPDILKFIHAKSDRQTFNNFNISVKITDQFMNQLKSEPDAPHMVVNPRTQQRYVIPKSVDLYTYRLQDLRPLNSEKNNCYTVGDIWKMIVTNAHATGEPGVCFIDRVNEDNPTPNVGKIYATNPCGEQPLLDYEACTLGSINVSKYILSDGSEMDWEKLGLSVSYGVRFLDNVIDATVWPIEPIQQISMGNRKIGLGIMGFADALILLGIRYDSEQAVDLATHLGQFITEHAHRASRKLAETRGVFPNWSGSIWDTKYHQSMRNAACTTIAPTGSISIIARCSGGIEPIFSLAYQRRVLDDNTFIQLHPLLEKLGTEQGWLNEKTKTMLLAGKDVQDIAGIPSSLAEVLVTAHQIDPQWHVRIQAAFQAHIDNAVSKTVNLPAEATVDEVAGTFELAYQLHCKGVTVYRDGSRENQVLTATQTSSESDMLLQEPRPRERITTGKTSKFRMGCGTLFVTVNQDNKGLCEVFANLGKAGGCPSQSEATCRAVSAALRSGIDPQVMVDQLSGIRCLSTAVARKAKKGVDVLSCPDAIAQALKEAMGLSDTTEHPRFIKKCPDCGQVLRFESGCDVCICGYSKCG